MILIDTALKALKPKEKTYTVSDDHSLDLEILPAGGIVWRYRLNGKYLALTLKTPGSCVIAPRRWPR